MTWDQPHSPVQCPSERGLLRSILDRLPALVFLLDKNHRLRFHNQAFAQLLGDPGQRPCHEILANSPKPCAVCPAMDTLNANSLGVWDWELASRSFQFHAYPFADEEGESLCLVVGLDQSGLNRVRRDRLALKRRLEQARRIESLNTLASGVAHEINQPLNALKLYASGLSLMLEQDQPLDPALLRERLGLILTEVGGIQAIVGRMRELVNKERNTAANATAGSAHLASALRRAVSLLAADPYAPHVQLTRDIPPNLPPVRADAVQLEQVLANLLRNAHEALQADPPPSPRIHISARVHADRVELTIADNGPGLSGQGDTVFEPFHSTKPTGMGLGLAIAHSLVRSWGGSLHSASGDLDDLGGATFILQLPILQTPE